MSNRRLALVLGDQLSFDLPSLQALNPQRDAVLLAEAATAPSAAAASVRVRLAGRASWCFVLG